LKVINMADDIAIELPLDPAPLPPEVDTPTIAPVESSSSAEFVDTATADIANTPEVVPLAGVVVAAPVVPVPTVLPPVDPILAADMQTLHDAIQAITPITGLSIINAAPSEIGYITPPTAEQEVQIAEVISGWNNLRAKNAQLREIENNWQATIAAGWPTPYGWKLGLTPQDITLLTGAFILAKETQTMGLASSGVIVDTDGLAHELSVADLTGLMLQYGQARAALSAAYAASKAALG
jgi:NAD(P)-dependent dehydrogenase (short-subunit alcohol dehydrogenase family)